MFTDIHSHILHGIDDGPKDFEQSVELLNEAIKKGLKNLIATPHFYPSAHSLSQRLQLADERFLKLKEYIIQNNISVSLLRGFEVRYFKGISKIDSLNQLCINGSKVLLLELDPTPFTEDVVDEILNIRYMGYTVVLAHVERYVKISGFKLIKRLIAQGEVVVQCNADSFLHGTFQRTAFGLLKKNMVDLIASDMHSIDTRPFNLKNAYDIIERKLGTKVKNQLILNSEKIFNKCL